MPRVLGLSLLLLFLTKGFHFDLGERLVGIAGRAAMPRVTNNLVDPQVDEPDNDCALRERPKGKAAVYRAYGIELPPGLVDCRLQCRDIHQRRLKHYLTQTVSRPIVVEVRPADRVDTRGKRDYCRSARLAARHTSSHDYDQR